MVLLERRAEDLLGGGPVADVVLGGQISRPCARPELTLELGDVGKKLSLSLARSRP